MYFFFFFFHKSRDLFKFVLVLLSASVERVGVSRMRDFTMYSKYTAHLSSNGSHFLSARILVYWTNKVSKIGSEMDKLLESSKKLLPFELICAVYLEYIVTIHFVCPYPNLLTLYVEWYISWTDLLCSAHQEPSRQKVASIWAYMCRILRIHSNL